MAGPVQVVVQPNLTSSSTRRKEPGQVHVFADSPREDRGPLSLCDSVRIFRAPDSDTLDSGRLAKLEDPTLALKHISTSQSE